MENQPTEFRERLLGAQPVTPMLREEYQRELESILYHRLTPRGRLLTIGALVGSIAFAIACVASMMIRHESGRVGLLLPAYAGIFVLAAVWLARVLKEGGFARRASFAMVEGLGGAMVGLFVTFVLFRTMRAAADPASAYWAIWAVLFAMCGFAWGTGNRIAAAKLETREHILRLESRLADLADRLPK